MPTDIIAKLKSAKLVGRGGAAFPTGLKWELVKRAKGEKKYVICNGSEGEPGVFKDEHILKHHPEEVIEGIKIALRTLPANEAIFYLRKDFYLKFGKKLKKLIGQAPITLFKKTGGYLAGEESVICEAIEGKPLEPRLKPPYPVEQGLWGMPTLINNIETLYYVSKIAKDEYRGDRFYSVSGYVKHPGVYELPENHTILQVLLETNNLADFDLTSAEESFFVQVGGAACGEILLPKELDRPATGQAALIVYDRKKTDLWKLMQKWADFFHTENCDKCVPCREGAFRIKQMADKKNMPKETLNEIADTMRLTSFCGLGKAAACPFVGVVNKLM